MAFSKDLVSFFNQVSGGRSESPTVFSARYDGPIADWTTSVTEDLQIFLSQNGATANDGLFLLTTEDAGATYNGNMGILQPLTATTTGFATAVLTGAS